MTADNGKLLSSTGEDINVLALICGALENGEPHWAYASIPLTKYDSFKAAEQAGNYDLADYGQVLEHGAGTEPPPQIVAQMKEKYGVDHAFEAELDALMRKINQAMPK